MVHLPATYLYTYKSIILRICWSTRTCRPCNPCWHLCSAWDRYFRHLFYTACRCSQRTWMWRNLSAKLCSHRRIRHHPLPAWRSSDHNGCRRCCNHWGRPVKSLIFSNICEILSVITKISVRKFFFTIWDDVIMNKVRKERKRKLWVHLFCAIIPTIT